MKTELILVRHGETEWSRDDRFAGISDIELTDVGRQQAQVLAERLLGSTKSISCVFSSPKKRCLETARIIARQLDLSIEVVPELRELDYGVWEGLRRQEILMQYADEYAVWSRDPALRAPRKGETGNALLDRVRPVILQAVADHLGECFVVVGHKTVNRLLICSLLGISPSRYRDVIKQDTACLNVLQFVDDYVSLIRLNDIAHYNPDPFSGRRG